MDKLNNNIIFCSAKKIGYSKDKSVVFRNVWKYSIDIYFDIEDMHASDLFLILFSYIKYKRIYCTEIYTLCRGSKSPNSYKFFSNKTSFEFLKMSYREFENWWEHRQWYDSILLEEKDLYGIRIVFVPELIEIYLKQNNITLEDFYFSFKPEYPWSEDIIDFFNFYIDAFNEGVFWDKPNEYKFYGKRKPVKR
jgi:hypothetical protein